METAGRSCSHVGVTPGRSVLKEGLKFPSGAGVGRSRKAVEEQAEVQKKGWRGSLG